MSKKAKIIVIACSAIALLGAAGICLKKYLDREIDGICVDSIDADCQPEE